jgi:nucleotide-binding universal stress UspA family protein
MNPRTNILLAIDVTPADPLRHVTAAVAMIRELIRDDADRVVVLYVREYSVARLGRMMTDDGGADGRRAVDEVVSVLRADGIHACGQIREADIGHVAQTGLATARDLDVRLIVLGSRSQTGLPRSPLASVTARLLHRATVPVLIVPRPEPVAPDRAVLARSA